MADAATVRPGGTVRLELQDPDWGYLVVDRPDVHNALDPSTVRAITRLVRSAPASVRMLVLAGGGGSAFLSGADIAAMSAMTPSQAAAFVEAGHRLLRALEDSPAVIGALVDGYALGGGTEIALGCDVVVATGKAVFGLPEVRLGIFPGWGGTQRLIRMAGAQRVLPHLLTGRRFGAEEASRMGFVTAVVADRAEAERWFGSFASDLRRASPRSTAAAKRVARRGMALPLDQALQMEATEWLDRFSSPDRVEGMNAFLAKRATQWEDGA